MDIKLFDYYLPPELIAQTPLLQRDKSRMLLIDIVEKSFQDRQFTDIVDLLRSGDVLVRNNSRVIPARLFGVKKDTNAHVEVLLLTCLSANSYECIVGNARTVKLGSCISFQDGVLEGKCIAVKDEGLRIIEFSYSGKTLLETLEIVGSMPLPPYIKEKLNDPERYQTVYSVVPGSAAAPTAGLHFTQEIEDKLRNNGVIIVDITLHVGLGTFRPVKVNDTVDHKMHFEYYELSVEAAKELNKARSAGRRVIAIGTTSLRALEANCRKFGEFRAETSSTDLFIVPGDKILSISGLLTNFHLPKSTLLMLVSAFAGSEFILSAYQHAINEKYRFFSFGDCMLLL